MLYNNVWFRVWVGNRYRDVLFEFHLKFWNTKYWYWYLEVLVFQLEVYNKVDKLLTGLTSQQKWTTAPWYSNKTSLFKALWIGKVDQKTLLELFSWKTTSHKDHFEVCLHNSLIVDFYLVLLGCGLPWKLLQLSPDHNQFLKSQN